MSRKAVRESRLSCAFCFEKHHKPQSLKCGHIFCTPCIEELFKQNQESDTIPCSICRAESAKGDLRPDFTMQELVDILQPPSTPNKPSIRYRVKVTCDVCEDGKWVCFCEDCQQYICPQCAQLHIKFKALKEHVLRDVEYLKQPNIQLFKALQTEYQNNLAALQDKQSTLRITQMDQRTDEVTKNIDNIYGKMVRKRDELNKAFRTEKLNHAIEMEKLNKSIGATCSTFKSNMAILDEALETQDTAKLLNSDFVADVKSQFKDNNAKFERMLKECTAFNGNFECTVFIPPALEGLIHHMFIARGTNGVQMVAPPVASGRIAQLSKPGVLYLQNELQLIEDEISKIRVIDEHLWIHGLNEIHVFNTNSIHIRSLQLKYEKDNNDNTFNSMWDSAQAMDGTIVVTAKCTAANKCYDGLFQIEAATGHILAEVARGHFASLAASRHDIYAMQMNENQRSCTICCYALSDSTWQMTSSVSLDFASRSESAPGGILPSFLIHESLVYFCDTKRIVVYTTSGAYCLTHNLPITCPKSDYFWRLVDTDTNNNLLLIEHNVSKETGILVVYDHNNVLTQLSVESLGSQELQRNPADACVDNRGKMWVLVREGNGTQVSSCAPKQLVNTENVCSGVRTQPEKAEEVADEVEPCDEQWATEPIYSNTLFE